MANKKMYPKPTGKVPAQMGIMGPEMMPKVMSDHNRMSKDHEKMMKGWTTRPERRGKMSR